MTADVAVTEEGGVQTLLPKVVQFAVLGVLESLEWLLWVKQIGSLMG